MSANTFYIRKNERLPRQNCTRQWYESQSASSTPTKPIWSATGSRPSLDQLAPGIREMKGNLSYFAGIDLEHNAMVNVSTWDSLEAAKQMETFKPMLQLASTF